MRISDWSSDVCSSDLPVYAHFRRHPVEQAAAEKKAVLIALKTKIPPVHHELGALLHAEIDIALHALEMRARDQRAHLRFGIRAGRDVKPSHPRPEPVHEGLRRGEIGRGSGRERRWRVV